MSETQGIENKMYMNIKNFTKNRALFVKHQCLQSTTYTLCVSYNRKITIQNKTFLSVFQLERNHDGYASSFMQAEMLIAAAEFRLMFALIKYNSGKETEKNARYHHQINQYRTSLKEMIIKCLNLSRPKHFTGIIVTPIRNVLVAYVIASFHNWNMSSYGSHVNCLCIDSFAFPVTTLFYWLCIRLLVDSCPLSSDHFAVNKISTFSF